MGHEEVRKGVTQAKESESGASFLFGEIFLVAVASGLLSSSWWVFGGVLLGTMYLLFNKALRRLLLTILTIGCGTAGWLIGEFFNNLGASVVLAIIAMLVSGGYHLYAVRWLEDI